jgi:hypothetical protein
MGKTIATSTAQDGRDEQVFLSATNWFRAPVAHFRFLQVEK